MRPARILVVDDNAGDARLTLEALREAAVGAEVAAVPDGEEALAYLRGEGAHAGAPRPDLVLLDLNLPRRDGREVLAEIKSDPALHAIPVIVLHLRRAARRQRVLRQPRQRVPRQADRAGRVHPARALDRRVLAAGRPPA